MKPTIVVPIKAHSGRLKDKNFIQLGGQPLYRWSFDSLLPYADNVVVVVDDPLIQAEAGRFGFEVLNRCPEWDGDEWTAWQVALEAVPTAPILALALVTCPFRRKGDIKSAIKIFEATQYAPVISVVRKNHKAVIVGGEHGIRVPDGERAYMSTGVVQVARRESIVDGHINRDGAVPYVVPAVVGLDIDTPLDWCAAFGVVESQRGSELCKGLWE